MKPAFPPTAPYPPWAEARYRCIRRISKASDATVWLVRSIRFCLAVMSGLLEGDRTMPLRAIARRAYSQCLEPHHQFWLRNTFKAGLSAMPTREELLARLAPFERSRAVRDALCYADIEEYVRLLGTALGGVSEILASFDLDDTRKA